MPMAILSGVQNRRAHEPLNFALTATVQTFRKPSRGTRRAMPQFGLREAARQVGVTKSTIHRAVQQGRLSASRTEGGGYAIDAAELFRVYPPRSDSAAQQDEERCGGQDAPRVNTTDATELRIRNAQLEAELKALRTMSERERRMFEDALQETKVQRDKWQQQAERLALAAPAQRRGWWPWRRS